MWAAVAAIIQLLYLILKTKFENDEEERKRKDEALTGWDKAVKSRDTNAINDMLVKLRMRP